MEMNTYMITTGLATHYVEAWTMAQAIIEFSQDDNLFTEVCEGDEEKFTIEKIEIADMQAGITTLDNSDKQYEAFFGDYTENDL